MEPIIFEMPFRIVYPNGTSQIVVGEGEAKAIVADRGGVATRLATNVPGLRHFGLPKRISKPIETIHVGLIKMLWRVCGKSRLICRNPEQIIENGMYTRDELGLKLEVEQDEFGIDEPETKSVAEKLPEPTEVERELAKELPNFDLMTKRELREYGDAEGVHLKMSMAKDDMASELTSKLGARLEGLAEQSNVTYAVVLEDCGENEINLVKALRELRGLDLKTAKKLVDGAPSEVASGLSAEDAEKLKDDLVAAGAKASFGKG